jgi:hypothetical protein
MFILPGFDEWRETGFLREYLVTGEEMGKNPVSKIVRGGQKPRLAR